MPACRSTLHLIRALPLVAVALAMPGVPLLLRAHPDAAPAASTTPHPVPYEDAAPLLVQFQHDGPPLFEGMSDAAREAAWPRWVAERNLAIRARIAQGDEDTLVNLWLFGTSFTTLPPARGETLQGRGGQHPAAALLDRRLTDLLNALISNASDERLAFARDVLASRGIDAATPRGRADAREFLLDARARILEENRATDRALKDARDRGGASAELAAHATIFQQRGLSSDTSILPAFAVEQGLRALVRAGALGPGSVRRVAVVGPGLDVINKADGYDLYPPQTVQPFALVDSLVRVGLAAPGGVHVSTFDVNPRVNRHLERAARAGRAGASYRVHVALDTAEEWSPALLEYWSRWGDRIGQPVAPPEPPPADLPLRVRAVQVTASVAASLHPIDLNIVLERLSLAEGERFDLIVATNVLVYYGRFEQALALRNIAAMLRPGGSLLTNTAVVPDAPMSASAGYAAVEYGRRQGDHMFWYWRE